MRNLKFRAWLKTKKRMVRTDELLVIDYDLTQIMTQQVFFESGLAVERDIKYYDFEDIELMSSTGLFDKKGVEIFEGDIIRYGTNVAEIKRHPTLGFYTVVDGRERFFGDEMSIDDFEEVAEEVSKTFEIIGNIYENPELLKN